MDAEMFVCCPICRQPVAFSVEFAGNDVICPSCHNKFEMPTDTARPVAPPKVVTQSTAKAAPLVRVTATPRKLRTQSPFQSMFDVFYETRPCKYCRNKVASNAKFCPKCGGRNPYPIYAKEVLGGCLVLIGGLASLAIVVAVIGAITPSSEELTTATPKKETRETQTESRTRTPSNHWTVGGTLHGATLKEWREASYSNRLATAADIVAATASNRRISIHSTESLRRHAEELEKCISATAATSHPAIDNQLTKEVAAACIILIDNQ